MRLLRMPSLGQAILILFIVITLLPIYFILENSVKTPIDFAASTINVPLHFEWSNYGTAWNKIDQSILNTVIIVVVSVVLILMFSAMSAYAFAKLKFPFRNILFLLVFSLLLIPGFLTLIPLYLQIKKLGLSNSYWALILPYIAGGQAFTVFVLKTFFEQLSTELFESARIDGAGNRIIFLRLVLPLSIPICTTVGIMNVNGLWNDYLLPSLLLDQVHQTLTIALVSFEASASNHGLSDYGGMMAAYIIASIPLLILFSLLMRNFVEGISSGAIKM
ncbi:carbohydrate ABC transporter permease [Paenibacillus glycanilyticus]|uniref:ABC transporter permease protein YurM n=1 Tax=Paenibacillus glycanilyticus TaxID=126569 RepID=A0ABQ6GG61_9BACL|nr:carbohydrate ABC transporter permease [Paenibacillus glycanilyticus]GLX68601.1 putative ABC transporter permease protein YurM [Paenibacillus glycanilyticus]